MAAYSDTDTDSSSSPPKSFTSFTINEILGLKEQDSAAAECKSPQVQMQSAELGGAHNPFSQFSTATGSSVLPPLAWHTGM